MISAPTYEIHFPSRSAVLTADLSIPDAARGIVIFAHGSGSNRFSPRNKPVAEHLNEAGFATVLADLLTEEEDLHTERRFDIELLTQRLGFATDWVRNNPTTCDLPIAYFGASTGAAAALRCAAIRDDVAAVVSRGGRPDLAGTALRDVH
ncbi:MAG: phosphoribosyltransferase, partial [Acidobacteriales bacterium]|nr:phosphoribosyltransferase [Terriglobales bacterium]